MSSVKFSTVTDETKARFLSSISSANYALAEEILGSSYRELTTGHTTQEKQGLPRNNLTPNAGRCGSSSHFLFELNRHDEEDRHTTRGGDITNKCGGRFDHRVFHELFAARASGPTEACLPDSKTHLKSPLSLALYYLERDATRLYQYPDLHTVSWVMPPSSSTCAGNNTEMDRGLVPSLDNADYASGVVADDGDDDPRPTQCGAYAYRTREFIPLVLEAIRFIQLMIELAVTSGCGECIDALARWDSATTMSSRSVDVPARGSGEKGNIDALEDATARRSPYGFIEWTNCILLGMDVRVHREYGCSLPQAGGPSLSTSSLGEEGTAHGRVGERFPFDREGGSRVFFYSPGGRPGFSDENDIYYTLAPSKGPRLIRRAECSDCSDSLEDNRTTHVAHTTNNDYSYMRCMQRFRAEILFGFMRHGEQSWHANAPVVRESTHYSQSPVVSHQFTPKIIRNLVYPFGFSNNFCCSQSLDLAVFALVHSCGYLFENEKLDGKSVCVLRWILRLAALTSIRAGSVTALKRLLDFGIPVDINTKASIGTPDAEIGTHCDENTHTDSPQRSVRNASSTFEEDHLARIDKCTLVEFDRSDSSDASLKEEFAQILSDYGALC